MVTGLVFGFLSYFVLVYGRLEMDIIRERLLRLETRFVEDVTLLRKELYQGLDQVTKQQDLPNEESHYTELTNADYQSLLKEIENLRRNVFNQMDVVLNGLKNEKRIRRNIEQDVESLRHNGEINTDMIVKEFHNLTRLMGVLPLLESLQNDVKVITEHVEVISKGTRQRVADCAEWLRLGYTSSGIYTVYPETLWRPLDVYCDMDTDGGGWTVFQRRSDGSENFYRNWMDYSFGFGNLSAEFWLGNEFIHRLTSNTPCELRIDMEDFENESRFAKYGLFEVGPKSGGYVLSVQSFTGNVNDSLITIHNEMQFSTKDAGPSKGCAVTFKGGWWYNACHRVNLNGLYLKGKHDSYADGVNWLGWHGHHYSLKTVEIKFRQK
ncbi:Fibrinogen-related domains (FReDs) [Mactra antiquata]